MLSKSRFKSFLFHNGSERQTIAKNTFWLVLAEAVSAALKLFLVIFVAWRLGDENYGRFNFALAFAGLFLFVADFGLNQIVTREFSRDKNQERLSGSLLSLKIVLSLLAYGLVVLASFFITADPVIRQAIAVLGLMVIVHSLGEFFFAVLRAREMMQYESWTRITESVAVTGLGLTFLLLWPSVAAISAAYLAAALLVTLLLAAYFNRRLVRLVFAIDLRLWRRFLGLSWPLAFVGVFIMVYNQIDSVMMGFWGQIAQTGWYNGAYRIAGAAMLPSTLLAQVFFPRLSAAFARSRAELQQVWNSFLNVSVFLALPLAVGSMALAPRIIAFVYPASFAPSVPAFRILMAMAGVFYIGNTFSRLLIAGNLQRKNFWIAFWGALFNVATNLYFIPRYSLYGAAATTLATFILMLLLFAFEAAGTLKIKFWQRSTAVVLLAAAISSLAMLLFIGTPFVSDIHILLLAPLCALVYGLVFWPFHRLLVSVLAAKT